MIAIRIPRRALAVAATLLVAAACGGKQETRGADLGDCDRVRAGMSAADVEGAAACHARAGTEAAADQCRNAFDVLDVATPTALADFARCVLSQGDRADGVWLADMMASVGDDAEALAALASVFDGAFDTASQGVTFTASLDDATQHALGAALPSVAPAARDNLVSLVLAYSVEPLAEYCAPYAGELAADDPGMVVFAERLAESEQDLGEFERRLLLETGVWSAQDALDCYAGDDPRCDNWEGESPLELFEEASFLEVGLPSTPAAALRVLRSDDIDPASARGIAAFIGGADYPNRDALMPSMMLDMTDSGFRREIRQAIASAATAPMCDYGNMRDYLLRARTSDPDRFDDPTAPWPTFIRACAERHWTDDDLMIALSAGSWLGVPRDTWNGMVDALAERSENLSCDEYRAMGRVAYEATPWVITRGTAHSVAARIAGDTCAASMEGPVEDIARDADEHPEARLAAYTWLNAHGDAAGCSRIDSVLDWYHEEYREGPGRWAEELGAELRAACN